MPMAVSSSPNSAIELLLPGSFASHIVHLLIFAGVARRVRISLLRVVKPNMLGELRRPVFQVDSEGLVKNAEENDEARLPTGPIDSGPYGRHDCFLAFLEFFRRQLFQPHRRIELRSRYV